MLIQCRCNFSTISQYTSWLNLDNEPTAIKYQLSLAHRRCTRLSWTKPILCSSLDAKERLKKRKENQEAKAYTEYFQGVNDTLRWVTLWVATSPGYRNHRQQAFIRFPQFSPKCSAEFSGTLWVGTFWVWSATLSTCFSGLLHLIFLIRQSGKGITCFGIFDCTVILRDV